MSDLGIPEDLEVFYPYQRLQEEGYQVDIAAPTVKRLQFVVHDFVDGFDTYTEKPGHTWQADVAFADVDPSEYVALVIPGGRAPEYIPPAHPTYGPVAVSGSTGTRSWTATSCQAGPGRTTRRGCAPSSPH